MIMHDRWLNRNPNLPQVPGLGEQNRLLDNLQVAWIHTDVLKSSSKSSSQLEGCPSDVVERFLRLELRLIGSRVYAHRMLEDV